MQVHEEVLRLLLAAVPQLSVERLAGLLATTLANSKRSRKCARTPAPPRMPGPRSSACFD